VVIGTRTKVKVVKNKVAPPFQEAEFDIIYNRGISRAGEVVDLGTTLGLIEKSGTHYALDGARMGQGRERAIEWMREHPVEQEKVAAKILLAAKPSDVASPAPEVPAPAEEAA
jgi:recombination protein RecA